MNYTYEESDLLNTTVECFVFDTLKEKFPVPPHWHYFAEMIFMLEGNAEMQNNNKTYIVSEGDMIVFPPKSVHSIYSVNNEPLKYEVIKFDINKFEMTAAYAPKLRSIFRSASKKGINMLIPKEKCAAIACGDFFRNSIQEFSERRYGYDLVINSALYKLMVFVIRNWVDKGFSIDNETFAEDDAYDIDVITEYISNKMNENLTVNDIALRCGMSYSYFASKFRAVYGMSCKEYIETMRVNKVEEFLRFTEFDLNYISQETGFSDCSHMIKCFKKFRGITPKQFRMKYLMSKQQKTK